MARLTEDEQARMAQARVDAAEQIAAREQATDTEQLDPRRARQQAVRDLKTRVRDGLTRGFPGLARTLVRARVKRELAALPANVLRDLGITRTEIARVAQEQAEIAVPPRRGATHTDTPYFNTASHDAYDVARLA